MSLSRRVARLHWGVALALLPAVTACRGREVPSITPIPAPAPTPPPAPSPRVDERPGPAPAVADAAALPLAPQGGPLPGSPSSFAPIVRQVRTSVVSVFAAIREVTGMQYGFNGTQERMSLGRGTGFLIAENGEILTNNHVIQGAARIEVQLDDGRRYPAEVLGRDERLDVALLRVKAPGVPLHPARLGDSDRLSVGDWVMAMGNPYGLTQSVTAGIVSAVGRTGHELHLGDDNFGNLLQTDASINPGNSGGPLLNLAGEVVGINVAVHRAAQGVGFAIPINMARTVVPQLRQYGRVRRSWLGVSIAAVRDNMVDWMHLPDARGALVQDVEPGSPAALADIRSGDVIRRFDGQEITDSTQLPWLASSAGIGHRSRVELIRQGTVATVEVTLAAMPDRAGALLPGRPGMVPIPDPSGP
jgi:serine protease Do